MSEHTPAPWAVCRWGRVGFEIQGGGHSIAIVSKVAEKRLDYLHKVRSKNAERGTPAHQAEAEAAEIEQSEKRAQADAALISAAPDLLEAAKRALPYLADHIAMTCHEGPGDRGAYDLLEAAITKAESHSDQ